MDELNIPILIEEAARFASQQSNCSEASLYGVTDGKAVGDYLEKKFRSYLCGLYTFPMGNSAKGIDFPSLDVDIKVTSVRQPQSSCPFKAGRQKIYGLGYCLLVFVYDKTDDEQARTGRLQILHTIFVNSSRTADYQMTRGLLQILDSPKDSVDAMVADLVSFMNDRNLPVDEIEANNIAQDLLVTRPEQGYLTISNALQWRLQYQRVINTAGMVEGIQRVS